jgi:rhodanese-related sulfurtransferase
LLICDIREADEYNREHIIGAKNTPLSTFDFDELHNFGIDQTIVFHCQSGNRTKMNEGKFQNIKCKEVLVLCDGINEWKKLRCAVAMNNKAPLPLMRQVQIVAGSLIVLGAILSVILSPAFILLSGFVGAGLIFAGVTGYCGMANILMLLPYNKNNNCNGACNK